MVASSTPLQKVSSARLASTVVTVELRATATFAGLGDIGETTLPVVSAETGARC